VCALGAGGVPKNLVNAVEKGARGAEGRHGHGDLRWPGRGCGSHDVGHVAQELLPLELVHGHVVQESGDACVHSAMGITHLGVIGATRVDL
jgi:hypothetical protein